jgi:hypothetical protein
MLVVESGPAIKNPPKKSKCKKAAHHILNAAYILTYVDPRTVAN